MTRFRGCWFLPQAFLQQPQTQFAWIWSIYNLPGEASPPSFVSQHKTDPAHRAWADHHVKCKPRCSSRTDRMCAEILGTCATADCACTCMSLPFSLHKLYSSCPQPASSGTQTHGLSPLCWSRSPSKALCGWYFLPLHDFCLKLSKRTQGWAGNTKSWQDW